MIGGCRINPLKYVNRSRVGEVGEFGAILEPLSQQAAFERVTFIVVSHDQLMHQDSEWFFRRPHREGALSSPAGMSTNPEARPASALRPLRAFC
jgi:hypothetical protein